MSIDELGRISQVELLEKKYQTEEGENIKMLGNNVVKPLEVRFSDVKINEEAFKTPYVNEGNKMIDVNNGAQTVTLTQTLSSLTVTKTKLHLNLQESTVYMYIHLCLHHILLHLDTDQWQIILFICLSEEHWLKVLMTLLIRLKMVMLRDMRSLKMQKLLLHLTDMLLQCFMI